MAFVFTVSGTLVNTATVNTEVTGNWSTGPTYTTITDQDVRALYIDWDDGVSNKREDANYEWNS